VPAGGRRWRGLGAPAPGARRNEAKSGEMETKRDETKTKRDEAGDCASTFRNSLIGKGGEIDDEDAIGVFNDLNANSFRAT
jgi:hypothetical protein